MRCERDQHVCTPFIRCDEADITSDRFPQQDPQCSRRNQAGLCTRTVVPKDGESRFGEFPWMAAVLRVREAYGDHRNFCVCGGSLIHPQVVLTATHCVHDLPRSARLLVHFGEWETRRGSEHPRHVDAEYVTAGWGRGAFQNRQLQAVLKHAELPLVPHASCQDALCQTRLRAGARTPVTAAIV
ncbi:phenoloxidase-activating factor 2-like [Pollicipes pollicipes]|uniref:phenoloxidase-activating factor 2-like n=1 Tax=Pollicipes pollicipes TaxID=41117 RepID=UPI001885A239|nr:phenoloxidase-activating factor 2-like [Pollicipes pollicipes]